MSSSSSPPPPSYITAQTAWPTAVPIQPEIQNLLSHFYTLLDVRDTTIGNRFADEIFTNDGIMFGMGPGFEGEAAIRTSRAHAWDQYISRRHEILRVYAHDVQGFDLLVIGRVEMGLRNGRVVSEEFVARFVVDEATVGPEATRMKDGDGARLRFSRVWSNMEPIMVAMREG